MCFGAGSRKHYYHEEVIPTRYHHHHHSSHGHHHGHHHHHSHSRSPRASYTSVRRSYVASSPRVSYVEPVVYERTSRTYHR
ncbi:hypothetical protein CMUS01_09324 [Colletotrichum musicola]|uniref:Uncharacterized protein n=2 Tax=Colletotrichum orchidearum species complex TaxID=2707337 RepID=A0A8H6K8Y7_9PEZI|nr:hypothetical protein CMUS01_09324 [Colletotrichum musicola]KAF6841095.1 hypothetical protein CPLU01_00656 [Colletotrichum plurivorum]